MLKNGEIWNIGVVFTPWTEKSQNIIFYQNFMSYVPGSCVLLLQGLSIITETYHRNVRRGFGGCPSPQPTFQSDKFAYLASFLQGTTFYGVIICISWLLFAQNYFALNLPDFKLSFEPNITAKFQFFTDLHQKSHFQLKPMELLSWRRNTWK